MNIGTFFKPKHVEKFENLHSRKRPRQTLCLFRMSPRTSENAISRQTLDSTYKEIILKADMISMTKDV